MSILKIECDAKSGRPFYRFYGVAYNQLIKGRNPTTQIKSSLHDRDGYYYDDAVKLSTHDLETFGRKNVASICGNLAGKPICVEHDPNFVVGEVTYQWVDDYGDVRITGRVYTDTPEGREKAEQLAHGDFRGLSVGYSAGVQDGFDGSTHVGYKEFDEISICREPFFPGCQISVSASAGSKNKEKKALESNAQTYKTSEEKQNNNRIWFKIMSSQEQQVTMSETTAAPVEQQQQQQSSEPTPMEIEKESAPVAQDAEKTTSSSEGNKTDEEKKDKEELLKATDSLAQNAKKLSAKFEESQKLRREAEIQNEDLRRQVEAYQQQFAESKQPELQSTLQVYKEANKGELPEEFTNDLTATILNPDPQVQRYAQVVCSAAKMNNNLKSENKALQDKLSALEGMIKKLQDNQEAATLQLNASRNSLAKVATAATATTVGKGKEEEDELVAHSEQKMSGKVNINAGANEDMVFGPTPGKADIPFMQAARRARVGVTASGAGKSARVGFRKAPVHAHMYMTNGELANPNSARFSKNPANRALFSFLADKGYCPPGFSRPLKGDEKDLAREALGTQ